MPAWLIPAIAGAGVAGGLFDTFTGSRVARDNTNRTIQAQKEEAELAYQRSLHMWNLQNEYNTPQKQMERFKAAGLNPHLIYGQGSAGLASSPPNYSPPDIKYQYQAPAYGSAVAEALPTLMSIGSWMQDMRLSEAQIGKVNVDTDRSMIETDRARQLVEFLTRRNPQLLSEGENKLSLFPYQKDAARYQAQGSYQKLAQMEQEYRYLYGDELFRELQHDAKMPTAEMGGIRRLQFLQEQSKTKLAEAKASWSEFDITDPQAIIQLVLSGVMGLAGQTLRLANRPKIATKRERPRGLNPRRMSLHHPDRKR